MDTLITLLAMLVLLTGCVEIVVLAIGALIK